jgi:type I restriction enzyme S subunit
MSARRFKLYPAYRDSGVEWLGKIPAHWEVRMLKRLAAMQAGGAITSQSIEPSGDYPVFGGNGIRGFTDSFTHEGDFPLIGRQGALCGCVNLASGKFWASEHAVVARPARDADTFWLTDLLAAMSLNSYSQSAAQPGLAVETIAAIHAPAPPLPEQLAIAAFLDRETARIDALVAKKERLIELLQEKRSALITRAVTKGLDPTVPMKDSGVEWLAEIPAHWEVKRIKWAAQMVSGHTPDKKVESYWQGGDIPWISLADTGQLREVDYISATAVMTTADGIAHSSARVLPAGTVVFSRDATIGLCAITGTAMAVSQHFIGWVCSWCLQSEYLLFVLRSMTQELERLTMGATVRTIGMPDVKGLLTPIPPLPEQDAIIRYVRQRRAQLDSLLAKIRDAIDRLKELRAALISAAVTGKIDVRKEVA